MIKTIIIFVAFLFLISSVSIVQNWQWVKNAGVCDSDCDFDINVD